jgi:hypothetical protein
MNRAFSLTPGFSPVQLRKRIQNRFNGFLAGGKPLKRLVRLSHFFTRLKPDVNETGSRHLILRKSIA